MKRTMVIRQSYPTYIIVYAHQGDQAPAPGFKLNNGGYWKSQEFAEPTDMAPLVRELLDAGYAIEAAQPYEITDQLEWVGMEA